MYFESNMQMFGVLEWSVLFGLSILTMSFAMTPTTYVSIVSGYFLGWVAVVPVVLSYALASVTGYTLSAYLDRGFRD